MEVDASEEPPPTGVDETLIAPLSLTDYLPLPTNAQRLPASNRIPESPEIEALLLAHRARTPVGVAVAQDYAPTPFCVPRPFVVLGWFWIIDAWVRFTLLRYIDQRLTCRSNRS
jgi:hypothetical protein